MFTDLAFWIIISQCAITIFLHIVAFIIFARIFYQRFHQKVSALVEVSPAMNFYVVMHMVVSLATIPFVGYFIIEKFQFYVLYNSYVGFIIFTFQKLITIFLPLSAFAVGLDRCFCVLYLMGYKRTLAPVQISLALIVLIITYSGIFIIPHMFPNCYHHGCIDYSRSYVYVTIRYFMSALILVTLIILLLLFHKKLHIHLGRNVTGRSNKIILFTLMTTFLLDFLPHVAIASFAEITHLNIVAYAGPISSTCGAIEAFICAILYSRVFKKTPKSSALSPYTI